MRLPSLATLIVDCGVATVRPLPKALGWLTWVFSEIVTVSEPWATAAGSTCTLPPITTVPVRALTTTLAGPVPGVSSRFSTAARKLTRAPASTGALTTTVPPSCA